MCGILGIFSTKESTHNKIRQNIKLLEHRGPDNTGMLRISSNISFAHTRLSIVDLDAKANQPMIDHQTGNAIIFNGEIYNYKEIREQLKNLNFNTNSDTEVLLYLLREKGYINALKECNGAFAFAFWDNIKKKLILARDRFGKKPLFYSFQDDNLIFASEAKAIFDFDIKKQINHKAVINYLFESIIGANKYSFFKNIEQIEDSTIYVFKINNDNKIILEQKNKYWKPPATNIQINYNEAVEKFKHLLIDAVKIRLSEEVPFAVMLSGGLDSSSITAIAANYNPEKKITAISAVYPDSKFDESKYAQSVVDKYNNINPLWIDNINYDNFSGNIKKVTWYQEMPVPDGSIVAQSILMQNIAQRNIKVVLSGIGGDEVLAGYPNIFYPAQIVNELKNFNLKNFNLRAAYHSLPNSLKNYIYIQKHKRLKILKSSDIIKDFNKRFQNQYKHTDKLNEYLIHSLLSWTIPNMVWFEDRSSMASSIENRAPLLDYRIVEFLLTIPGSYKIDKFFTKKIIRDALKNLLPEEIRNRKDKQGFHAPIKDWKQLISLEHFNNQKFIETFNYLDFNAIKKSNFNIFWRTYSLYIWFSTFF